MVATKAPAQGSSLRHLAMILFGNRDLARCEMAFFTAYFDASGSSSDTHAGASLFVSGFVSSAEKWLRFEDAWRALLIKHEIDPPFHMTDFEAGEGQYANWRGDFERRQAFILEAAATIRRHTLKPFSHGVVIADLGRMFSEYDLPESLPDKAFPWCAVRVIGHVRDWAARRVRKGQMQGTDGIEFVFEDGDKHWGQFAKHAKADYGVVPIPRDKAAHVQFDACDLLGWEHRRFLSQWTQGNTKHPPRPSLVKIAHLFPHDAFTFQRWDKLDVESQRLGFKRREPVG